MEKLDIIYEDKQIIVVNKPPKMLTISDGKSSNTLYSRVRDYVKKQHKSNKIFIVHRLDRETSGIVLFAKNEQIKKYLQDNWLKITKRKYMAILEGKLDLKKGVIKEYLKEDKFHKVYASDKNGSFAETKYEVINKTKHNTVVNIEIKTGRKNQIRVAFKNLGYPLIGDKKYHSLTNPLNRLGLHAFILEITINNKNYKFIAPIPKEFTKYQHIYNLT